MMQRLLTYWKCPSCYSKVSIHVDTLMQQPYMQVSRAIQEVIGDMFTLDRTIFNYLPQSILDEAEAMVENHEAAHGIWVNV